MKPILFLLALLPQFAAASPALEAAREIAGTYAGEWAMYGVGANEEVKTLATWTDVLVAKDPVEQDGKAFVTVHDEMKLANGAVYPRDFTEGYFVNADGSAGARYFELGGQVVKETKLGADTWAFETTPSADELSSLGFDSASVLFAKHITMKAVTRLGALDTECITRTTTVQWKNSKGEVKVTQFTSMKGHHTRRE